jgi:hypothetical protein
MFWRRRKNDRRVLEALAATPSQEMDAATVARHAGMRAMRTYPHLVRLQQRGWVVSRWSNQREADTHQRGPMLYRASKYGLWIARGRNRSPFVEWWPDIDRPPF